jgi:hypothetical protein
VIVPLPSGECTYLTSIGKRLGHSNDESQPFATADMMLAVFLGTLHDLNEFQGWQQLKSVFDENVYSQGFTNMQWLYDRCVQAIVAAAHCHND